METRDPFSACHPVTALVYFALVLGFGMTVLHPACLAVSLLGAAGYCALLTGSRGLGNRLRWLLPAALLAAAVNAAFNHRGVTVLAYLPSGNPLTLESIAYGGAAGAMLSAVILWCGCLAAVMTTDKFVYLFGRVSPRLSLLLSMILRFLPACGARYRAVREAQAGLCPPEMGWKSRAAAAAGVLSATVTWSLESAAVTADSMKSRGYSLPGRSFYAPYRLDRRDGLLLAWLTLCGGVCLWGCVTGRLRWMWFPAVNGTLTGGTAACLAAYAGLCAAPLILRGWEELRWKCLRCGM